MRTQPRVSLLVPTVCAFFLLTASASAQTWTHAASACAVDESSTAKYDVNAARLKFKSGETGTIVARCNVTNVGFANAQNKFFQIHYRDTDGTSSSDQVRALLYKVHANGGVSLIATLDSNDCPPWTSCNETGDQEIGRWVVADLDFENYAYFVEIRVTRAVSGAANDPTISMISIKE